MHWQLSESRHALVMCRGCYSTGLLDTSQFYVRQTVVSLHLADVCLCLDTCMQPGLGALNA